MTKPPLTGPQLYEEKFAFSSSFMLLQGEKFWAKYLDVSALEVLFLLF